GPGFRTRSGTGSFATRRGRGRARSPRAAPRRRWRARRRTSWPSLQRAALGAEALEERVDPIARFFTTVEAAPALSHEPDQRVASVDRRQEALGRLCAPRSPDQQRFDVRLEGERERLPRERLERSVRELRLRGAGRARIERDPLLQRGAEEKEREPDRDAEPLPLEREAGI